MAGVEVYANLPRKIIPSYKTRPLQDHKLSMTKKKNSACVTLNKGYSWDGN